MKKESVPVKFKKGKICYNFLMRHPVVLVEELKNIKKTGSVMLTSDKNPYKRSHYKLIKLQKNPNPNSNEDSYFVNRRVIKPSTTYVSNGIYDNWNLTKDDFEKALKIYKKRD